MNSLTRYDPFGTVERMQWEIDRFFDDAVGISRPESLVERLDVDTIWSAPHNRALYDNLAVDMTESDDAVMIRTVLPGVRPEDVDIEERDGWLLIRAQSKDAQERNQAGWRVRERRYGVWQRTLRLPATVDVEQADAHLHNGVLTLRLPKVKEGKPLFQRIKLSLPRLSLPKLGTKKDKVKISRK